MLRVTVQIYAEYEVLVQVFLDHCIPENMCLKPLRVQFEGLYAVSEVSTIKQSLLSLSICCKL